MKTKKTLEYYFEDGRHIIFDKYTIDTDNVVRYKDNGRITSQQLGDGYIKFMVRHGGGRYNISLARAMLSTFKGAPPQKTFTADHINSTEKTNNTLTNLRWASKSTQVTNQERPTTLKTLLVIVRGSLEMTAVEWAEHLKDQKNHLGRKFTSAMINDYAIRKQHGFSYKEYQDLPGEIWVQLNEKLWVSNKCRIRQSLARITRVIQNSDLVKVSGYPTITSNKKKHLVHILVFQAFYPELWAQRKPGDIIHNISGDKIDFRPENLCLMSQSHKTIRAHETGKFDGTSVARKPCAMYDKNGVLVEKFVSLSDAGRYIGNLKNNTNIKAISSNINEILDTLTKNGTPKTAYGFVWRLDIQK